MNNWSGIIQDWLFPPTCLLCGDAGVAGRDLCPACTAALPFNRLACPRCARPLAVRGAVACGECLRHPPSFDASFALLRYQEPVCHLVRALKFHARHPCARLLGGLLGEALAATGHPLPERILPVPLHPSRYRARGYNQSLEIARHVSRCLSIPLDAQSCRRVLATVPQTELADAKARRRNVRDAFALAQPLRGRHVAIVDDVMTTGATVNALAAVLRKAGAQRIEVWAVARAGHD